MITGAKNNLQGIKDIRDAVHKVTRLCTTGPHPCTNLLEKVCCWAAYEVSERLGAGLNWLKGELRKRGLCSSLIQYGVFPVLEATMTLPNARTRDIGLNNLYSCCNVLPTISSFITELSGRDLMFAAGVHI